MFSTWRKSLTNGLFLDSICAIFNIIFLRNANGLSYNFHHPLRLLDLPLGYV